MSLILAVLLSSNQALPFIDRAALHTQAKFEAARTSQSQASRSSKGVRTADRLIQLCRTASELASPADFAAEIRRAYSMAGPEVSILKTACSAHLPAKRVQTASLSTR